MTPAPRRAQQRDRNELDVINAFHRLRWQTVRHDRYDLQVQCPRCSEFAGGQLSVEVKNPEGRNRDTKSQKALKARGWYLHTVTGVADVLALTSAHAREFHA